MGIQTLTSPSGEELVVLSRSDYDDLVTSRDHARAVRAVAEGRMEAIADADMDGYLAAASPLAFWRKRRGLTQSALAGDAGISQAYLSQIETGARVGDVLLYVRLARTLGLRVEDLVDDAG